MRRARSNGGEKSTERGGLMAKAGWLASIVMALVVLFATPSRVDAAGELGSAVAPVNTEAPVASWNGYEFSCSTGAWTGSPPPSFSYQWLQGESAIPSATGQTYAPAFLDPGRGAFACEVTASNSSGKQGARSEPLSGPFISCCDHPAQFRPPSLISPPTITGNALPGGILSCSTGTWAGIPMPSYSYRWLSNGAVIDGAGSPSLEVPKLPAGTMLSCEVTASNVLGHVAASSAAVPVVVPIWSTGTALAEIDICGRHVRLYQARTIQATLAAGLECSAEHKLRLARKSPSLSLVFESRESGVLTASWYLRRSRAHSARRKRKRVLVAHGSMAYDGSGVAEALIAGPTSAGRALLDHAGRFPLIARASFTPEGAAPISVTERLVIHVARPSGGR